MTIPVPKRIEQEGPDTLAILWSDGNRSVYPVRVLRQGCPCALCIDEFTGEKILDPESVPADVRPESLESVGRYALRIQWSDGHNTGIYSFQFLRQLNPGKRADA